MAEGSGSAADYIADDLRVHVVSLQRFNAKLRADVLEELKKLERDISSRLIRSGLEGSLTASKKARFEGILASVRETIRAAYSRINAATAAELRDLASLETDFVTARINRHIGVEGLANALTGERLRAVMRDHLVRGAPSSEWWSRQAGDVQKRFADTIRQGLLAGDTNADLVRRVRGTRANGFTDGIMHATRKNAESLVRTSVQQIANDTMKGTYEANPDVVNGYTQISTLDSRTSEVCVAYSGMSWKLDGTPVDGALPFNGGPPRHFGCRSTLVPWLKSFRDLGIDIDEIPPSTRASLDGQVPQDITFNDFLSRKSTAFQNDLLGEGKAQLWRDGKINLTDLVDQRGRPQSLARIRSKMAAAEN